MDLYREEVMDHYEHPRHVGEMSNPDYEASVSNASCGDSVRFQLRCEHGLITSVCWKGIGCAISTAAASKLSEWLIGQRVDMVQALDEQQLLKESVGLKVNPGRLRCLTLPIRALQKLWENSS
jgi:nitrogen fixation protein NifU and related proteins